MLFLGSADMRQQLWDFVATHSSYSGERLAKLYKKLQKDNPGARTDPVEHPRGREAAEDDRAHHRHKERDNWKGSGSKHEHHGHGEGHSREGTNHHDARQEAGWAKRGRRTGVAEWRGDGDERKWDENRDKYRSWSERGGYR